MSDINTALPVRTEGDITEKLQTRIIDSSNDANRLTVNADGSINITDNGASITVDATDLDIRDLSASQDNVAISDGTETLEINADGSINSVVTATDFDIRDLTHVSDSIKVGDGTDFLEINADGSVNVDLRDGAGNLLTSEAAGSQRPLDVALRDSSGNVYSALNPLPVSVSVDQVGTELNNYNTDDAVAAGSTSIHDYLTTSDFKLTQIEASSSGKMKVEVQIETAASSGTFTTIFVKNATSAQPNISLVLASPVSVESGAIVRVIRTNREPNAQDVYSTICGQLL